jgi:hypothetical protein
VTGRGGRVALFLGGLAAVAALPILGRAIRGDGEGRCAYDGVRVTAPTRVRIEERGGRERLLCCVDCARKWLAAAEERPERILVTDESTGAEIAAGDAWYVESRVVAFPICACRIHVFAREADARDHARDFGGVVLEGEERPIR